MNIQQKEKQLKKQQLVEAKKLLVKMNKEQAIYFCEQLAKKLPNINETPPIHRQSEDKYQQFWRFGVISALNSCKIGIKKIAIPINASKNKFIKYLKDNNAKDIEVFENFDEWDYYRVVSGFVGDTLYTAHFTMWKGTVEIVYSYGENRYNDMSIEDFNQMLC